MSWQFNPPPGWPQQPQGWVPPPGWTPDPSWPPAPAGWQFWVPATTATAPGGASQPTTGAAATQPVPGPATQPGFGPAGPGRPWFRRWWAYALLLLLLLVGAGAGYGATWLVITIASNEQESAASPDPALLPTGPVEPSPQPPLVTPPSAPIGGLPGEQVCGEVAVIMITMTTAIIDDFDDLDDYQDALIDSRRAAAGELRQLTAGDAAQRDALDTLADELDSAAQLVEDNRGELAAVDESFNAVSAAYADFNTAIC